MARDHLAQWPAPPPADVVATYHRRYTLTQWLIDQAPPDLTAGLAAASDRAHHLRVTDSDPLSAQAEVSALVTAQRRRDEWVARHHSEITTWARLEKDIRRFEYRLGQAATYTRPDHLTAVLGPLPERIGHVERWQSAAGAIEAYRTRWNITGPVVIGLEPAGPEQRDHWDKTVAVVVAAGYPASGGPNVDDFQRAPWRNIHTAYQQREDDGGLRQGPSPSPPSLWPDEPDLDVAFDEGFGL